MVGEIELTPIGVELDGSRRVRPSFARTRPPTAGTASTWSAPRSRGASGKAGKASRRGTRGQGDKRPWRKGRGSIGRGSLKRPRGREARGTVTRPRSQEATGPRGHGAKRPWSQEAMGTIGHGARGKRSERDGRHCHWMAHVPSRLHVCVYVRRTHSARRAAPRFDAANKRARMTGRKGEALGRQRVAFWSYRTSALAADVVTKARVSVSDTDWQGRHTGGSGRAPVSATRPTGTTGPGRAGPQGQCLVQHRQASQEAARGVRDNVVLAYGCPAVLPALARSHRRASELPKRGIARPPPRSPCGRQA